MLAEIFNTSTVTLPGPLATGLVASGASCNGERRYINQHVAKEYAQQESEESLLKHTSEKVLNVSTPRTKEI
jgi:hypothetical protein